MHIGVTSSDQSFRQVQLSNSAFFETAISTSKYKGVREYGDGNLEIVDVQEQKPIQVPAQAQMQLQQQERESYNGLIESSTNDELNNSFLDMVFGRMLHEHLPGEDLHPEDLTV